MNFQKRAFIRSKGMRLVMAVPPQTIRMMRTIVGCGVAAAWLSARMPGAVLVSLILLTNSKIRLIGLQPLVGLAAVTVVNAAALTLVRSVSGETSTSLLATPLVLTLRWRRLSRSLLRGKGGCTCDNGLRAGRLQI